MIVTAYLQLGFVIALVLFALAQLEKSYFTKIMNLDSFSKIITDSRVIIAFTIVVLFWPIIILKILFNNLN